MPTIRFANVTKRYGTDQTAVLEDFSLSIDEGEFCVLLGRSGAGKSTALKLVNRLIEPTSGRVFVDGSDVRDQDPHELRRSIGYVLQRVGLLPHLNVRENVALVPSLAAWPQARIDERVEQLLTIVGLSPKRFERRMPAELSGGQQQRVGLARALAARPRVLLMDEPFGSLDPVTRSDLRREVAEIQGSLRLTTIMVTHDVVEALLLADVVVVLDGGRVVQRGAPRELWNSPIPGFVERLLSAAREDMGKLEQLLEGPRA